MPPPPTQDYAGATILVTGGAGFVGGALAAAFKVAYPGARIVALDNLRRAGSELRRASLRDVGVEFVHADIRNAEDLALRGLAVDMLVECSAEPSVRAGYADSPRYVIDTNLLGTVNCLELARDRGARVLFLSTSRVYPTALLNRLAYREDATRFVLTEEQTVAGASAAGISETFPIFGSRTFYGMTKLASEMLLEEYAVGYGLEYAILRFGVISGPGQMGKVEQGVFALWMARHLWGESDSLTYHGWGGVGKQLRDVTHIDDACDLVLAILSRWDAMRGKTLNAGGGGAVSTSLYEATAICERITGRRLRIGQDPATHPTDVRIYITDHTLLTDTLGWRPARGIESIFEDLHAWMTADADRLRRILA